MFHSRKEEWKKDIYIAKKIGILEDDYGNTTAIYEKPEPYRMNVQPISSSPDIEEFGENASLIQKAVIDYDEFLGKFKEFDVAYLEGATPDGEEVHGANANFRLYPPRNQNKCIILYFERLVQGKSMQSLPQD